MNSGKNSAVLINHILTLSFVILQWQEIHWMNILLFIN